MEIKTVLGSETEYGLIPLEREQSSSSDYRSIQKFLNALDIFLFPQSARSRMFQNTPTLDRLNWWDEDLRESERGVSPESDSGIRKISAEENKLRRLGLSGSYHLNGARFYIDADHAEHSTPECLTPHELVLYERAGDKIMRNFVSEVERRLGIKADLLKRNWDYGKASYACHENYLVSRPLFNVLTSRANYYYGPHYFSDLIANKQRDLWLIYLISRLFITGSGRFDITKPWPESFSLSQRQPFIVRTVSLATMKYRSLINTRDRPYADPTTFGRLHVICGDSNRSDWSILLRSGSARLVLLMLEDLGYFKGGFSKWSQLDEDPVSSFQGMKGPGSLIKTKNGTLSALQAQVMLYEAVENWLKWFSEEGNSVSWAEDVMLRWRFVLESFEAGNEEVLSDKLDWLIKRKVFNWEAENGASADELQSLDYNYHLIGNSFFDHLVEIGEIQQIFKDEEVARALVESPKSRAFLRSSLIKLGGAKTDYVSWHSVGIRGRQISSETDLTEIRMPDPRDPDIFYFYNAPTSAFLEKLKGLLERR
jgi:proteasome accessory factor A